MSKPVESGTPAESVVNEELRLLGRVAGTLSSMSAQHAGAPDYDTALINLRDQIAEAKPEDLAALVEQMTRISAIAQRYGKGRDLPVDPSSPYFAHLRLEEDDRNRDVLIGKRGFIDRGRQVQIVDWRNAPVSRIYYRYEEGDDYEEHFGDRTLEGQVRVRRALTIDHGQLRRIGAPQGTFFAEPDGRWYEADAARTELAGGQGTAARPPKPARAPKLVRGGRRSRLGHGARGLRADKHLPEIAALIDPLQFDLITQPDSGLIVLQGGAGTGKTTVALHRVAYLNYAAAQRFRPERILVAVPSHAMVRYVERVLPSLGVNGVHVQTTATWFSRTRRRVLRNSPRAYNDDTPAAVLRLKKHPVLMTVAREYVARQSAEQDEQLQAAVASRPEADAVLARWRELADRPPVRRCLALRDWLPEQPQIPAVTRQQAESAARQMVERARDVLGDWSEILTDRALLTAAVHTHCADAFTARDIDQVIGWCARQTDESESSSGSRDEQDERAFVSLDGRDERDQPHAGRLDPPDDAILLYLHLLKQGALRPPGGKPIRYEHVVADEAQDLSAIELSVLLQTTGPRRCATFAGDSQQRLVFDNHFSSWEALLETLGVTAASNTTLELGYRSTAEVMSLARSLIGDRIAMPASTAVRSGAPVELHRFGDQGEAVAMLADALRSLAAREPLASVALIARHPALAKSYAAALERAEVASVRLVRDQDFSFRPGIEVTDVTEVKGLEFDYVVVLDANASNYGDNLESRHLLHIAATRAAHQLWLIATGPPSPVLPKTL